MNVELMNRCDLLVRNTNAIKKAFAWEDDRMSMAGGSFYVGLNKEADIEKMLLCERILKNRSSMFSEYRGNVKMPLICKMADSEDPAGYFDAIDTIVKAMKEIKWIDKDYKIIAAMTIYDHVGVVEAPYYIDQMNTLYHCMKKEHPWLTSDEDIPFAAILAVSKLDTNHLVNEMENCYQTLKPHFSDKNALQTLSHVLALDPADTGAKCEKLRKIYDLLKAKKHKYSADMELAVLGTLTLLELDPETIVDEIIEADEYLKPIRGFGNFSLGSESRRMYAALMVMDTHMPPASETHESLLDATLAIVIAMEICMVIMMTSMACATAAAAH